MRSDLIFDTGRKWNLFFVFYVFLNNVIETTFSMFINSRIDLIVNQCIVSFAIFSYIQYRFAHASFISLFFKTKKGCYDCDPLGDLPVSFFPQADNHSFRLKSFCQDCPNFQVNFTHCYIVVLFSLILFLNLYGIKITYF